VHVRESGIRKHSANEKFHFAKFYWFNQKVVAAVRVMKPCFAGLKRAFCAQVAPNFSRVMFTE
jgi:hypothetical protein